MNDNPLTQDLIGELNAISQLKGEEQKIKLEAFMKKLTPQQLQYLKQSSCLFCAIAQGGVPSNKIYEDDIALAVLDINPAAPGHTLVIPKKHYFVTAQIPDEEAGHLFTVANAVSKALFEELKPGGTNIFIANGHDAGQNTEHVVLHVIPRHKNDGIVFSWKNKKTDKKDLDALTERLKGKTNVTPRTPSQGPSVLQPTPQEEEEESSLHSREEERIP